MSHLESLGFAADLASLRKTLELVISRARSEHRFAGGEHRVWRDPSGASIVVHADARGAIDCITPFFESDAPTEWRVRSDGGFVDPECLHCSGADCDLLESSGQLVTRAALQWRTFARSEPWLARQERSYLLRVVAFAHQIELFHDEGHFEAAQEREHRFAVPSFVPLGMFGGSTMGERACAMFVGRVTHAEWRRNELTGGVFAHLRIETLPGAIDVVASRALMPSLPTRAGRAVAWVRHAWILGECS